MAGRGRDANGDAKAGRRRRPGAFADRIVAVVLFATFAGLVYLAGTGRFDAQIRVVADALRRVFGD